MLCSRYKQILLTKTTLHNNVQYRRFINTRFVSKRYGVDGFWATLTKNRRELQIMSSIRYIFKDLRVNRLWSTWSRSVIVGHVVRRCRKDRIVRDVFYSFRQTFLRSKRSLLFYATAACHARDTDEKPGMPHSCAEGISDEDLENLVYELDGIEELSKKTLYCENCKQRILIRDVQPGVNYCPCKDSKPPEGSPDGWKPYMEAEDVIIWRREYKAGQGLYAYKVYGRYNDVKAEDFAAVNVDAGYRRKWDDAVAALAVVERNANGMPDQAVLHWEVLWPRLFANRDYVYIRRHKEFAVKSIHSPHIFDDKTTPKPSTDAPPTNSPASEPTPKAPPSYRIPPPPPRDPRCPPLVPPSSLPSPPPVLAKQTERPSVHDKAKQASLDMYSKEPPPPPPPAKPLKLEAPLKPEPPKLEAKNPDVAAAPVDISKLDKIFVIISRSCTHPEVPPTRNAIRVMEYWSHMVVKTLHGDDKVGMEFVLTYYDEPAVGGMPSGVTSWATGRATPVFLSKIRQAAKGYANYRKGRKEDAPDFTPFRPEAKEVSFEEESESVREEDMESSKTGPEMNVSTADQSTQTDETHPPNEGREDEVIVLKDKVKVSVDKGVNTGTRTDDDEITTRPGPFKVECQISEEDTEEKVEEQEESKGKGSWWRYMYPPYYLG